MSLNSLALRTDLVHDRHSAEVVEHDDCIVIKTPQRPTYFWGNYLIMRLPPGSGDARRGWSDTKMNLGGGRSKASPR